MATSVKAGLTFLKGCGTFKEARREGVLAGLESGVNWDTRCKVLELEDALSLASLHLPHWFQDSGFTQLSVPVFVFEGDYFELYLDRALCSHFLRWSSDTHLTPSHPLLTCWGKGLSKGGGLQGPGTRAVEYEKALMHLLDLAGGGQELLEQPARKAEGGGHSHLPGNKMTEGLASFCLLAC